MDTQSVLPAAMHDLKVTVEYQPKPGIDDELNGLYAQLLGTLPEKE